MGNVPVLFAICAVVDDLDVDEDAVGQGGAGGHEPYGTDGDAAGGHLHARPERVQDHEEAIDSDRSQCERRHVNRRALSVKGETWETQFYRSRRSASMHFFHH